MWTPPWNAVPGAETYQVFSLDDEYTVCNVGAQWPPYVWLDEVTGTSTTDTLPSAGEGFYYFVRAVNSQGAGELGGPDLGYHGTLGGQ